MTKIFLILPLLVTALLMWLNLNFSTPPAVCIGCSDQESFSILLGWPATFRTTTIQCIGGDPNSGPLTKIGCVLERKQSYRFDGLALDFLLISALTGLLWSVTKRQSKI